MPYVSTLAGSGSEGYSEGTGTAAQFRFVTDLVTDNAGNVYVTDGSNYRVRKITPGGLVSTFAGSGNNSFADGVGASASFSTMLGIAIDGAGNLYIADLGNHRIRKVTANGVVSTVAGSGIPGFADGPSGTAQFHLPMGVAVDNLSNIFVADAGNNRIRKISYNGDVSTIAGTGVSGFADGAALTAQFSNPMKIKLDVSGSLIVLDQNNNKVRKISNTGFVTTIAGNGTAGFMDGAGSIAQFNYPAGLATDAAGNIYVGDQLNHRIRKITPVGTVSTLAGTGTAGYLDGVVTVALLNRPCGLDITAVGVIYTTDNYNHTIRKITIP